MTTTSLSKLSIHYLNPFGVQLTNIDLDSLEQCDRIRKLLYENGVVVIPANGARVGSEPIHTEAGLLKLARVFGQLGNDHPVIKSREAAGKVEVLETMGDTGIPADSYLFHSDMSWRVNPPRVGMLCARVLPPKGGDTRFRSAHLMYENLSLDLREQLHTMRALHSLKQGYIRVNRPNSVQVDIQAIHPAVIKHPETGFPLLYLNSHFTVALLDISEQESTALLERIFEEAARAEQILSHTWSEGDIVIWDNWGVQHRALADYEGFRRMHRVVVYEPDLRPE